MQMHAGVAMRESDHPEVDGVIAAFFGAFDNRHGRIPDAGALARLFAGTAVVAMHSSGTCTLFTPEEFIAPRIVLLGSGELVDFHEWEEAQTTQVIGSLALRSSRYAKSGFRDGAPVAGTGSKFFQLARISGDWKIVALSWIDDA